MNQEKVMILIQGVLDGNQDSENKLYSEYRKYLIKYLNYNYSAYHDIDDDISEILIKIFVNLKKYNPELSEFNSWVTNVAKYYMIDKWRVSGTTTTTSLSDIDVDSSSYYTSSTSFDTYNGYPSCCNYSSSDIASSGAYEVNDTLQYITSTLSIGDCTLLNMKYVQGYSYNEIGSEFNITSSTVSNKVNYIKSKLKKDYVDFVNE